MKNCFQNRGDVGVCCQIIYIERLLGCKREIEVETIFAESDIEKLQHRIVFHFHTCFTNLELIFQNGTIEDTARQILWKIDSYGRRVKA